MMNNIKDEFDEIDELINESATDNDNDNEQLLKDALTEVRELKKMYQQEIARYKEVTRQLQIGLSELQEVRKQFEELQELMEDEDEDEVDEDIEE